MVWTIIKLVAIGFAAITGVLCLIKDYKEDKKLKSAAVARNG